MTWCSFGKVTAGSGERVNASTDFGTGAIRNRFLRFSADAYLCFERRVDRYVGPVLLGALFVLMRWRVRRVVQGDPKAILLVKLHGIGNIVLLLPVLRRIRRRYPNATIDFLTFRSNEGILDGVCEVSQRHFFDRGGPWRFAASVFRVFTRLRKRKYDLVIDFDQFAYFSALASLFTGAPVRVGFRNPTLRRHIAYTLPVVYLDMAHVSKTFDRLADAVGVPPAPCVSRRIVIGESHVEEATALLAKAGIRAEGSRLVILHPGSSRNFILRRWPAQRFAALGRRLAVELGCDVVVTGDEGEADLANAVCREIPPPSFTAAGSLSILGFAALCDRARLVVSNDTAAIHIASAMGTPVVGLYGPNTPYLYGPLGEDDMVFYAGLPCSPCFCNITSKISHCRQSKCMDAITVDAVFEGIRERYFQEAARVTSLRRRGLADR